MRCLLLIEDDPGILDTLTMCIESMGIFDRIDLATNYSELVSRCPWEHDTILVDFLMPGFTLREIAHLFPHPERVVVVSAMTGAEEQGRALGFTRFLAKPFSVEALQKAVAIGSNSLQT
jgi:CheY-like chemotaxis protein